MHPDEMPNNPMKERMERRRAKWELERLALVRRLLEAGIYTKKEAKERGIPNEVITAPASTDRSS